MEAAEESDVDAWRAMGLLHARERSKFAGTSARNNRRQCAKRAARSEQLVEFCGEFGGTAILSEAFQQLGAQRRHRVGCVREREDVRSGGLLDALRGRSD